MQPTNATKNASKTESQRRNSAGAFARAAFDHADHFFAMRMRMHAAQADAVAAAL